MENKNMEKQEMEQKNSIEAKKIISAWDSMWRGISNRPWYEKLWTSIYMFFMFSKSSAKYYFMGMHENILAKNDVVENIKDYIEFGYDLEMIYNKIMNGSYGNEAIDEKKDWFKIHGIDWKAYIRKGKITSKTTKAKVSEWQLCPKCSGNGSVNMSQRILGNPVEAFNPMANIMCDVCQGHKIIVKPIVSKKKSD